MKTTGSMASPATPPACSRTGSATPRPPAARSPNEDQRQGFERALRQRQAVPDEERPEAGADGAARVDLERVPWYSTRLTDDTSPSDEASCMLSGVERSCIAPGGASAGGDIEAGPALRGELPPELSATAAKAAREAALDPGIPSNWAALRQAEGSAWHLSLGDGRGLNLELQARRADGLSPLASPQPWQLGLHATGLDRHQLVRHAHRLSERLRGLGLAEGDLPLIPGTSRHAPRDDQESKS